MSMASDLMLEELMIDKMPMPSGLMVDELMIDVNKLWTDGRWPNDRMSMLSDLMVDDLMIECTFPVIWW